MLTAARPVLRDTESAGLSGVIPLMPVASLAMATARSSARFRRYTSGRPFASDTRYSVLASGPNCGLYTLPERPVFTRVIALLATSMRARPYRPHARAARSVEGRAA